MPVRCPLRGVPGTCGVDRGGHLLAHCWVLRQQDLILQRCERGTWLVSSCSRILRGIALWCGVEGVTGLLFENYIVDASILKQFFDEPGLASPFGAGLFHGSLEKLYLIFVVKFLRAHGGCLGIRSRRRTWESAISLGELITER